MQKAKNGVCLIETIKLVREKIQFKLHFHLFSILFRGNSVKGSWRDSDKERERGDGDEEKRVERWDHKGNNRAFDPHPPPLRRSRSNHHDNHDNLPEW